jgi:hypothetical protein
MRYPSEQQFITCINLVVAAQKRTKFPRVLKFQIVSQTDTSIIVTIFLAAVNHD